MKSFKKLYFDFLRVTGTDGRRKDKPEKINRPARKQKPKKS